jgi:ParB-like chromosome segregation protein Spo0J
MARKPKTAPEEPQRQMSIEELAPALGDPVRFMCPLDKIYLRYRMRPDKPLLDSIRHHNGVLQPVTLLMNAGPNGTHWLVDGIRRVIACEELGIAEVDANGYEAKPESWAALALELNTTRSSNPVAEYEAIKSLQGHGLTLEQIAKVTHLSTGTIKRRLRFANLTDTLYSATEGGRLSPGIAEQASKLSPTEQRKLEGKILAGERVTGADVAAAKQVQVRARSAALPDALFDPDPRTGANGTTAAADDVVVKTHEFGSLPPSWGTKNRILRHLDLAIAEAGKLSQAGHARVTAANIKSLRDFIAGDLPDDEDAPTNGAAAADPLAAVLVGDGEDGPEED